MYDRIRLRRWCSLSFGVSRLVFIPHLLSPSGWWLRWGPEFCLHLMPAPPIRSNVPWREVKKKQKKKTLHMSCQGLRSALESGLISAILRWVTTEKLIVFRRSCLRKYITKDGLRRADRAAGWFSVAPGHSGREEEEEEVEGGPAVSQLSKLHLYTRPVTLLSK